STFRCFLKFAPTLQSDMAAAVSEPGTIAFSVKYSGKEIQINSLSSDSSLAQLQSLLYDATRVAPDNMKLLGLKGKNLSVSSAKLSELGVKNGSKLMLIGTPDAEIKQVTEEKHESVEFLEDNEAYCDGEVKLEHRPEYLDKIERRIREYKITELQAPRAGKKLLVLDIDYTFFDHKSVGSHIDELTRPYIHHLLTVAYPHYDIAIWSATSMKWIYSKLGEMRLFASEMFKISLLVDSLACISVYCEEDEANVNVKPLAVIWGQYPQYSASNTIMIDDIRRNFAMNPQSGLRIRPFRQAHQHRQHDRELIRIAEYLEAIADVEDFRELDHRRWEKYAAKRAKKRAKLEQKQGDSANPDSAGPA
ncbi:hypothetical protein BOX15_Mlig025627g2, partial [Macrostomum lignano]